jgi:nucleoside-diphosphate-sugar epimerase
VDWKGDMVKEKLALAKRMMADKNVLVTGGCGFIGSHLVKRLVSYGAKVKVFEKEVRNKHEGTEYISGDVRNYQDLLKAMEGISVVFHFSALLGVERIRDIPADVMEVNLRGTINALKAAEAHEVERFLIASSSEVYGEPRKLPISEDDDKAPVSFYGVSKLAAEGYCMAYYKQRGLKTTSLRFFNVYGPGQTERFVIPIFISKVAKGEPPVIYGHGNQSRCYTFVDDAIDGVILSSSLKEGIGEAFNIGNDEEVSVEQLAQYIISISGKNSLKPIYKPFGEGIRVEEREILKRRPDILKARTLLGFEVSTTWQEGIKRSLEWYMSRENK